jgi:membrane-associated phospholipid phosphatase
VTPEAPTTSNNWFKRLLAQLNGWILLFNLGLALLLTILMGVLTVLVLKNKLDHFDEKVENTIAAWNLPGLHHFFDLIAGLSEPTVLGAGLLLALAVLWSLNKKKATWLLGLASVGGIIIPYLLKNIFQRVRPGVDLDEGIYSYPSGHAAYALCFFGILIYIAWAYRTHTQPRHIFYLRVLWSAVLAFLILSVGLSRIYLELHYPTDIIAGFLVGTIYLLILTAAFANKKR